MKKNYHLFLIREDDNSLTKFTHLYVDSYQTIYAAQAVGKSMCIQADRDDKIGAQIVTHWGDGSMRVIEDLRYQPKCNCCGHVISPAWAWHDVRRAE